MSFDEDSDPTTNNNTNDSLRSKLSRRGYLSACAAALAAGGTAAQKAKDNASEKANGKGLGRTPPGHEDDEDEDETDEEDGDENVDDEEEAEDILEDSRVVMEDQFVTTENPVFTLKEWEMPAPGYMSFHDLSRFDGADVSHIDELEPEDIPERENPICGSIVGISEYFEPDFYEDVEVPVYTDRAPAVEFGHAEENVIAASKPIIAIPHLEVDDDEGDREFDCTQENGPEDIPLTDGEKVIDHFGVDNDICSVYRKEDDEEDYARADLRKQLILDGELTLPSDD